MCLSWPRQWEKARNPNWHCFSFLKIRVFLFFFFFSFCKQTNKLFSYLSFPQFLGITVPSCIKQFHTSIQSKLKKNKKNHFFHNSATSKPILHTFEKYPNDERDNFLHRGKENNYLGGWNFLFHSFFVFYKQHPILSSLTYNTSSCSSSKL